MPAEDDMRTAAGLARPVTDGLIRCKRCGGDEAGFELTASADADLAAKRPVW